MLSKIKKTSAMLVSSIKPELLRQLWSVVEETQTNILLDFSDTELVQQLLRQLQFRAILNAEEITTLSFYIDERLVLIRDLAESR